MDYFENTGLLLRYFLATLHSSVFSVIDDFRTAPVNFILSVCGFVVLYLFLNIYKMSVMKRVVNRSTELILYAFSPVLFVVVAHLAMERNSTYTMYILPHYFGLFWLSWMLLKLPVKLRMQDENNNELRMGGSLFFTQIFVFLAVVLAFYRDLALIDSDIVKEQKAILSLALFLSRLFLAIGLNLYIRPVLPVYLRSISVRYGILRRIFPLNRFLLAGFFLISLLWVFNIVALSFKFIIGLGLLVLFISFLFYAHGRLEVMLEKIYPRELYRPEEMRVIDKNFSKALYVGFFMLYYQVGSGLLDYSQLTRKLSEMYLVETKLFSLSVYGLITSVLLFVFLKSTLFLFTKYLRNTRDEDQTRGEAESMETIVYNLGILVVAAIALLAIGVTWQIVVPIAGALGIGFGFGLQTILNNYASGFILLFSKKVRIGDLVELSGSAGRLIGYTNDTIYGRVVSIDMFATTIRTFDNIDVAVPNSSFISDQIINYTRNDSLVRMRVPVGVAYSSDVELVKRLIMEAVNETESIEKNEKNEVWFVNYGESSLDFLALCWVDIGSGLNSAVVKTELLERIWFKFKENNVEIPFPQRDVWIRQSGS